MTTRENLFNKISIAFNSALQEQKNTMSNFFLVVEKEKAKEKILPKPLAADQESATMSTVRKNNSTPKEFSSMQNVMEAFTRIEEAAKQSSSDERFIGKMKVKQAVRQGDIYLVKIKKTLSEANKVMTTKQLAPGSTQGSRHFAEGSATLYESDNQPIDGINNNALRGPIVKADERFLVTHPEHANVSLPSGTYQVLYQLDFQAQRRVAD